ncbi:SgcJ/EcaC family oxidoreductase [Pueribacillus theae]|nr:SgcJ/EcaC family oxidoreductase [Pueribacillus theae]
MTMDWAKEKKEIETVFDHMFAAWSRGDANAYAHCFTEDVDYVTFFGQHLKGKQEVEDSHHELFNGVLKGSQMEGRITGIRFLNDRTAIVHCIGNTKMPRQKDYPKNRESINTNILIKQGDEWLITAFHNCRIKKFNFIIRWLMNRSKAKNHS